MKLFKDYDQSKTFLPPSLNEFLPEDHEAQIISKVVDGLDLSPLFAKYNSSGDDAQGAHLCL